MEKWAGNLLIDLSPPEKPKYKSPLVLIHGLWSSSRCWQSWATHFSNLGWECWSVNLRGRFGKKAGAELKHLTFQDCVEDLKQVIRAAPFPPVVVAHDLGGLAALKALEGEEASAAILIASLPPQDVMADLPRALKLLRLKYRPLLFLRRPFRIELADFRKLWLGPSDDRGGIDCLVPDAPGLVEQFFARSVKIDPEALRLPVLVAAAVEDRVVPIAALGDFARRLAAEFRDYPGHGHWIIGEDGGEEITRDLHRWIMQKAGGAILLEQPTASAAE